MQRLEERGCSSDRGERGSSSRSYCRGSRSNSNWTRATGRERLVDATRGANSDSTNRRRKPRWSTWKRQRETDRSTDRPWTSKRANDQTTERRYRAAGGETSNETAQDTTDRHDEDVQVVFRVLSRGLVALSAPLTWYPRTVRTYYYPPGSYLRHPPDLTRHPPWLATPLLRSLANATLPSLPLHLPFSFYPSYLLLLSILVASLSSFPLYPFSSRNFPISVRFPHSRFLDSPTFVGSTIYIWLILATNRCSCSFSAFCHAMRLPLRTPTSFPRTDFPFVCDECMRGDRSFPVWNPHRRRNSQSF